MHPIPVIFLGHNRLKIRMTRLPEGEGIHSEEVAEGHGLAEKELVK